MEDESLELAATVGRALICIQMVELLLGSLLRTAFRAAETVPTVQELEREQETVRRATLGCLIKRLRQKVELDPELETYLNKFVEDRNRFVHHLVEEASKSASDEDHSRDFSKQMLEDSIRLMELFFAKCLSWYQALQPNEPMDEETKRYVEQAGNWKKPLHQLFRVRGS